MSMVDLWVIEINGKMEQMKKLYIVAELWLRGLNMRYMSCGIFHRRESYLQVKIFNAWVNCCFTCWNVVGDVCWMPCESFVTVELCVLGLLPFF